MWRQIALDVAAVEAGVVALLLLAQGMLIEGDCRSQRSACRRLVFTPTRMKSGKGNRMVAR
jgi:hypothetical protein